MNTISSVFSSSFLKSNVVPVVLTATDILNGKTLIQSIPYSYTGSNQTAVIPAGASLMSVQLWGAGGASRGQGTWTCNIWPGGGGGYSTSLFTVNTSMSIRIIVGQGGQGGAPGVNALNTYGGGGHESNADTQFCNGSGGGRTSIQQLGVITSTIWDDIITAGGGGASGVAGLSVSSWNNYSNNTGGAGGGLIGGAGGDDLAMDGKGGTQLGGGAGGAAGQLLIGVNGSKYQGGGGGGVHYFYGSGAGGGYYGGGSGGNMNAGGGGSSYCHSSTLISPTLTQAILSTAPNLNELPSGISNIGSGGLANPNKTGTNGYNGFAIIQFYQ